MALRKIKYIAIFIIGFFVSQKINAQVWNVTTTVLSPTNTGSFEYAITQAMAYSGPVATIQLSVNIGNMTAGTALVKLSHYLPTITFSGNSGKTLIIQPAPDPTLPQQGFDLSTYTVMPYPSSACVLVPGYCWWPPYYGIVFDNNPAGTIVIKKLKFADANKYYYKFLNYAASILNPTEINTFLPFFNAGPNADRCLGGPECMYVSKASNFTVEDCIFENYISGITYKKVDRMTIRNNLFTTDAIPGPTTSTCVVRGMLGAIIHRDVAPNTATCYSDILTNTIVATPSTLDHDGTGIVIEPNQWYTQNGDNQGLNVPANLNFNITGNKIKNCWNGIIEIPTNPNRTYADLSYQLKIDGNEFVNATSNISIGGPFKHFRIINNSLTIKSVLDNMGNTYSTNVYQHTWPTYLSFGTFSVQLVPGPVSSGGGPYQILTPQPNNAFGFDIIYPGNTLGLGAVNHSNTFNFIPNANFFDDPTIKTIGNFSEQINFVGLNLNSAFLVFSGKNTNIRETKVTLNGNTILNPTSGPIYDNPIRHFNWLFANPPSPVFVPSNGNLSSPTLKSARISNNLLKIAFELNGTSIAPLNGPFVIEFFKSNIKGELTAFIGKQTINTLTNATYSLSIPPPGPVTLVSGDRIGVTLTSLGTNNTPVQPLGTSTVAYIYTTPCDDCISDFAPIPGKEYIVSCWTRSQWVPQTSYNNCKIKISFYSALTPSPVLIGSPLLIGESGPMIDDWQKIEGKVSVPANATSLKVQFINSNFGTYVDDVRFFPVDGTVKSYAYDPDNMRLMAELDERNYATFYEYDEEGKLIRVKKETEKGIMTIKESRNNKPTK